MDMIIITILNANLVASELEAIELKNNEQIKISPIIKFPDVICPSPGRMHALKKTALHIRFVSIGHRYKSVPNA